MWTMRAKNGPSLPLAGYLCGVAKLQGFSAFPHIYIGLLLALLCAYVDLALESSLE